MEIHLADLTTDELVDEYFAADSGMQTGANVRGSLTYLGRLMTELESRGVCPRDLDAPAWFADDMDATRGVC